jgi:hypothetical protein
LRHFLKDVSDVFMAEFDPELVLFAEDDLPADLAIGT